jgi:hypothetical protein
VYRSPGRPRSCGYAAWGLRIAQFSQLPRHGLRSEGNIGNQFLMQGLGLTLAVTSADMLLALGLMAPLASIPGFRFADSGHAGVTR